MEYDAAQVKRMNATYMMISKALKRGALSPRSAVSWAARAGRGEDVSVVASLARSEWRAAENRKVAARSNSQLAQQILDLLGQAVDGAPGPDDEFAAIFPPNDMPRTTLIYDQNDDGRRRGLCPPRPCPPATSTGRPATCTRRTPAAGTRAAPARWASSASWTTSTPTRCSRRLG